MGKTGPGTAGLWQSWTLGQGSLLHPHVLLHRLDSCPPPPTGLLNPLDSPHHVRQDEESEFREGVVVDRPTRPGRGSFVNCGMKKVGIGVGVKPCSPGAARRWRAGGAQEWGAWDPGISAHQCPTDAHLGQRSAYIVAQWIKSGANILLLFFF